MKDSVFLERTPLSLRFSASEVTLSGYAGGEYLPLPASKGPAFPFPLTLMGTPLLQQISLMNNAVLNKIGEAPAGHKVDIHWAV